MVSVIDLIHSKILVPYLRYACPVKFVSATGVFISTDSLYAGRHPLDIYLARPVSLLLIFQAVNVMPSQSYSAIDFAYTLFLFTKDDIKTTIVPVVSYSIPASEILSELRLKTVLAAASSLTSLAHLPRVIFWTWLHLLQINLANQIINPEEDRLNKSSRPIVSDKITLYNAQILRWMSIPICLAVSMHYSSLLFYVSLTLATMTIIYNELGGHLNWIARGILLSIGYALFEIGACSLAGTLTSCVHLSLYS